MKKSKGARLEGRLAALVLMAVATGGIVLNEAVSRHAHDASLDTISVVNESTMPSVVALTELRRHLGELKTAMMHLAYSLGDPVEARRLVDGLWPVIGSTAAAYEQLPTFPGEPEAQKRLDEALAALRAAQEDVLAAPDPASAQRALRSEFAPAAGNVSQVIGTLVEMNARGAATAAREALRGHERAKEVSRLLLAVTLGCLFVATAILQRLAARDAEYTASLVETAEDSFRLLVASVRDYAIIRLDPAGTITSWNLGAERMKGYEAREIVGKHFSVLYPEEDVKAGKCDRELEVAAAQGRLEDEGFRVRKDGSRFLANVVITALRNKDGSLRGFAKVTRDVTEGFTSAEKELQARENLLRLAVDATGLGIWEYDLTTGAMRCDARCKELFGLPPGALVDHATFLSGAHPDDRVAAQAAIEGALEPEGGGTYALDFRTVGLEDRVERWVSASGRAFFEAGRARRLVSTVHDITDRKHAESELREADRRKDDFLAMLAHELRNPLAPITLSVELLRRNGVAEPGVHRATAVIDRQVQQLTRLVDDLLEVSRIKSGKIRMSKETTDGAAIVRRAVETSAPAIEARKHRLSVVLPEEPVELEADPVRMAQAMSNLLSNAAKYTDPGGRISVSVKREGSEAVFRVQDDGVGIPCDMLERIFDLFTQVDRSLDRSQGGLGIGLTFVRAIVEHHGGTVRAFSAGPGQGSELMIRVPALAAVARPATATADRAPRAVATRSLRIVAVDDNKDVAEMLSEVLVLLGHEVEIAFDGGAALDLVASFHPDVVLLDIGLPKMDGYEVARRLRAEPCGKDVLLIALTGYGQDQDRQRAMKVGFDHHLVKPLDLERLEAILARRINGPSPHPPGDSRPRSGP
jgi:two-component system CheB/CheR fusion protein